jgi:predicted RNA-binding protein (virulence factor B family)
VRAARCFKHSASRTRGRNLLPLPAARLQTAPHMAILGKRNTLTIVRQAPPGYYLDGGPLGEILLPGRYIPPDAMPGGKIEVFVYRDSEDRLVATTETPRAMVGDFAFLRVVSQTPAIGAFLDWGLEKDLFLPRREYAGGGRQGARVLVHVMLDERSDRIVATCRLNRHLNLTPPNYAEGQPVKLIIESETPLGYKAIINSAHTGLLYRAETSAPLAIGESLNGFIRTVRADGKLDLGLDPVGHRRLGPLSEQILAALKVAGGHLPYHDGSAPDEIRGALGMSKKAFKQSIGVLFRERRIVIEPDGIRLAKIGREA